MESNSIHTPIAFKRFHSKFSEERLQELEELRLNRLNSSIALKEKFDHIDSQEDEKHDLVPEEDSEVLKETSEQRKNMMENFKKALERGESTTTPPTAQHKEELANLETNTKSIREKILNAVSGSIDNTRERTPISLYDTNIETKVEYVSEPRATLNPNLVKSENEPNTFEQEITKLKSEGSATSASQVKKKFENMASFDEAGGQKKAGVYDEIMALVKEGNERRQIMEREESLAREGSLDSPDGRETSISKDLASLPSIDTKEKIAKFQAIERGTFDDKPMSPKPPRELTPPREGEKVIYENEPIRITDPNYVSANSSSLSPVPGQDSGGLRSSEEPGTKDSAKTLANFFESIPNTPQQVSKEMPNIRKFTDVKLYTNETENSPVDVCPLCGQKIYAMEKMEFDDKPIHKTCFKCRICGTPLRLDNYAKHDNGMYCMPHFKQLFANEPGITQAN